MFTRNGENFYEDRAYETARHTFRHRFQEESTCFLPLGSMSLTVSVQNVFTGGSAEDIVRRLQEKVRADAEESKE